MTIDERAKIVAFARLLGVTGSDKEIFDKYWEYYQNAQKSLRESEPMPTVRVMKRPF